MIQASSVIHARDTADFHPALIPLPTNHRSLLSRLRALLPVSMLFTTTAHAPRIVQADMNHPVHQRSVNYFNSHDEAAKSHSVINQIKAIDINDVKRRAIEHYLEQQVTSELSTTHPERDVKDLSWTDKIMVDNIVETHVLRNLFQAVFIELESMVTWRENQLGLIEWPFLSVAQKNTLREKMVSTLADCYSHTAGTLPGMLLFEALHNKQCPNLESIAVFSSTQPILTLKTALALYRAERAQAHDCAINDNWALTRHISMLDYFFLLMKQFETASPMKHRLGNLVSNCQDVARRAMSDLDFHSGLDAVLDDYRYVLTNYSKCRLHLQYQSNNVLILAMLAVAVLAIVANQRELATASQSSDRKNWTHVPTTGVFACVQRFSLDELAQLRTQAQECLEVLTSYAETVHCNSGSRDDLPVDSIEFTLMSIPAGILRSNAQHDANQPCLDEQLLQCQVDLPRWLGWVNKEGQSSMSEPLLSRNEFIDMNNSRRSFSEMVHLPGRSVKDLLASYFPGVPFAEAVLCAAREVGKVVAPESIAALTQLVELNDQISQQAE